MIERSRKHLKQKFAAPVLKYAAKKDRLYLGVDFELQMLPVDLIFYDEREGDRNNILVDSVCYVEADTEIDMGKQDSLIVGNPKFGLHVEQKTVPLPCGELECARIADMLGVKAYVGWDASPKALWGRNPKNIIHISTHGVYMMSEYLKKTILYDNVYIDSFLMLAGYDDWKAGKKDKDYGNGSISGEDFLFMDLSGTDLIVLSACMSGYGSMMGLGLMHGMRWAISAAGARNSVTALWGVEDDATAVLMLLFYRNLFSMPVGEALYQAKRRLREITVAELRADKDFLQIIETASEERRDSYWRNRADEYMPFSEWRCWAGFVCYHR